MGLLRADNTNLDNGVTNRNAANLFGSMAQLDPTRFHTRMEDFDKYLATDWAITGAGAGTIALAASGKGGVLELTTAGADNDAENIQAVGDAFSASPSESLYFRCKFNVDDSTESDIVAGLAATVATPQTPGEAIVFQKADGAQAIVINSIVGSAIVATATLPVALADFVDITLEFYYDGVNRIYYGANGAPLGFLDVSGPGTLTIRDMALTFGVQAGQAVPLLGSLDYMFAAQERG